MCIISKKKKKVKTLRFSTNKYFNYNQSVFMVVYLYPIFVNFHHIYSANTNKFCKGFRKKKPKGNCLVRKWEIQSNPTDTTKRRQNIVRRISEHLFEFLYNIPFEYVLNHLFLLKVAKMFLGVYFR